MKFSQKKEGPPDGNPSLYFLSFYMLFKFKCTGVQLVIRALHVEQLLVGSSFDDVTVIEYHDGIAVADC